MAHRPYVGRLAPSPTGDMHLGIARTSLVAWLDARAHDGQLRLRIEDLDRPRTVAGSVESLLRDLEWLGIDWDGPPVFQSDRDALYLRALDALGPRIYPCTCSRKEIRESSAPHPLEDGEIRYPGTCRNGPSRSDRPPAWRLRTGDLPTMTWLERSSGFQTENVETRVGDFVLRRSDGLWAYQLAVTVDDLDQGVTCVVRGGDLATSSGRQVLLRHLLSSVFPSAPSTFEFLHLPLMMDRSGQKLSKRHGAKTIAQERATGVSPTRLVARLAQSLGIVEAGDPVTPQDLIEPWRRLLEARAPPAPST
ncbi:MAG: tRNA glutamyl-Q(34) synthetase GluQRS [Myxococcota bacterium]